MAKTNLVHMNCGGSVVGVLTGFYLVTPFVGIGHTKITLGNYQFLTKEFQTPTGESDGVMKFMCIKCKTEIDTENVKSEIGAVCVICGNTFPSSQIYSTEYSPFTCKECMNTLGAEEYKKLYDIPVKVKRSFLSDLLIIPVKI